jgi:hypothetical protein
LQEGFFMGNEHPPLKTYRVCLGHVEVRIRARNEGEAVELARLQLSHELPRLYDVIRQTATTRFEVKDAA